MTATRFSEVVLRSGISEGVDLVRACSVRAVRERARVCECGIVTLEAWVLLLLVHELTVRSLASHGAAVGSALIFARSWWSDKSQVRKVSPGLHSSLLGKLLSLPLPQFPDL